MSDKMECTCAFCILSRDYVSAIRLLVILWETADDWHGEKAFPHYRSDLDERIKALIVRGQHESR